MSQRQAKALAPRHRGLWIRQPSDGGAPDLRVAELHSFDGPNVLQQCREQRDPILLRPQQHAANHLYRRRKKVVALLCLRSRPSAALKPNIPGGLFHFGVVSRGGVAQDLAESGTSQARRAQVQELRAPRTRNRWCLCSGPGWRTAAQELDSTSPQYQPCLVMPSERWPRSSGS